MSSPCKKLKLTPTKRKGVSDRYTQESKVTSTPQRASGRISSPNISRICSSSSGNSVRSCLSDVFEEESNISHNDSGENETNPSVLVSVATTENSEISYVAEEDYDTYLKNLGKIKYTGNVWKQYKPVHEESLYARVLKETQNVQEIVTEYFIVYNSSPEEAIYSLLEFCVNVCGFQNFDMSQHYDFREDAPKRVIKMMESDRVLDEQTVLKTGKYLFMEPKGQLAMALKASIYNFLQKLIINGHERGILHDEFFAKHLFLFVKEMSFSELRAVHHTGVIFGIKLLTAVVMVYNKIVNDANYSSGDTNDMSERQLQKQDINNFMEFFYFMFIKNCRLQDTKVVLMRIECIHELVIWIRYFPKIFITQLQAVNYLIKLIIDASREVRYAALETCERLVATPIVLGYLKDILPEFTEAIGKRFYDVDRRVAIKAIDIFTLFFKYKESFITTHRFKLLVSSLVFDKCFPIGQAAARFLIFYLQSTEKNDAMVLIQLAKVSTTPGYATKELLIEGCIDNCSVIRNWDVYIKILLRDDVEMHIREALAELFSESVHQTLTGKSTKMRELSRKVINTDLSQYAKIGKRLPEFNELLKKYKDCPNMLIQFLKIFLLLNDDAFKEIYCTDICVTMEILFSYHNNEGLLNKLAETFQFFSNVTSLSRAARHAIESMASEYAKDLLKLIADQDADLPECALRVKVLFSQFNLTKHFKWEALFDAWGKVDESVTCSLLVCCKWYLIWNLRNITDAEDILNMELAKQITCCSRACKEFISTTFNMLQNLDGQPLHFVAYECLCDIHITYMKELERPIKILKLLEQLKLTIDSQLQTLLVSFLDKYVISNATMSLYERRAHVVNYINLVHHNVISIECLAYVFKYYHCYYKEFGPIIESSLTCIAQAQDENILLMVVTYTITIVYEHILSKYNAVDIKTEEAKDLKLLVKQLLSFKEFRSSKRNFKALILLSCKYAFRDQSKYAFLYFAKYFVDLVVDDNDRDELFKLFKNKIPKGAEKNDAVLFLANYMKSTKTPATKRKPPVEKKSEKTKPKSASKGNHENKKPPKVKKTNKTSAVLSNNVPSTSKSNKSPRTGRARRTLIESQETDVSEDDLTIHDSESDDLDESFTELTI